MKKSITKNYIYNLIYQILIIILPLITTPYLSRVLGATGIGIYSYTLSIVTYFVLFGSLGMAMYGQREIAYVQENKEKRSKVFWEIFLLKIVTLSISMVIFYFTYATRGEYQIYYKIFIWEIVANCIDISWFFQGMEEFKKTVIRNIFIKIISLVLIFTIVKTSSDLSKYIFIYVFSNILANFSLWFYLPKYIKKMKLKELNFKKHLKQSISLFIPQVAVQIYTVLDRTMLGNMITDINEVGYYEQAQKIVKMSLAVVTALGTVMSPRIANTYINNDKEKLDDYIKRSFNFVWLLGIPIMFGLMGIARNFVPWFFGTGFEKVELLMILCSPIILAIGLNNVSGVQYLIQVKKQNIFTITVIIGAVVNLVLNFLLIPIVKSAGAVIASVLAETIILIAQLIYTHTRNEIKIESAFKGSLKYIISGVIMGILVYAIGLVLEPKMISTMIQILIGASAYFILLFVLKDKFLMQMINKGLEKIKGIKGSA